MKSPTRFPLSRYVTVVITLLFIAGCKKSGSGPAADVFPDGVNVYMAGEANGHVAYWKNGQLVDLGVGGEATGITLSGTDVYVSATLSGDQKATAAYWKNNTRYDLSEMRFANAYGIAVIGTDVYVGGVTVGNPDTPVYWKNGIETPLSLYGYTSSVYDVVAAGSDIYMIAGGVYLLKNGGPAITGMGPAATCNSVIVAGTDIYVAGDSVGKPFYWKNGQAVALADNPVPLQPTLPLGMAISGPDVYVAGVMPIRNSNGSSNRAVYWKNGVLTTLDTQDASSSAEAIAVIGKDVYVSGFIYESGKDVPVYWKNGQMVRLGTNGTAEYMVVGS
ncbi:MAG TPA: hypothetical protein VGN00_11100 [Puia sp.]|jgi:hypothetical protein